MQAQPKTPFQENSSSKKTYHSNRIKPPLRILPHGGEKTRRPDHKDPIQRLRVVGRGQLTRVAHVVPQRPELGDADVAEVDHVAALADGRLGMAAVRDQRAQGQHEAAEVLVQGEEPEHFARGLWGGCVGGGGFAFAAAVVVPVAAVGAHGFGVHLPDLVHVEGDPPFVAPAGPLWVQASALLVLVDVDGFVEVVEVVGFAPVLCVSELFEGLFGVELAGAEVAEEGLIVVGREGDFGGRSIVAFRFAETSELVELGLLGLVQVTDVGGRPLEGLSHFCAGRLCGLDCVPTV